MVILYAKEPIMLMTFKQNPYFNVGQSTFLGALANIEIEKRIPHGIVCIFFMAVQFLNKIVI